MTVKSAFPVCITIRATTPYTKRGVRGKFPQTPNPTLSWNETFTEETCPSLCVCVCVCVCVMSSVFVSVHFLSIFYTGVTVQERHVSLSVCVCV